MSDFVIHGIPGSPYVRTALLVLEEKGLSWRLAAVPMGGNRTEAYRAIHPFQKYQLSITAISGSTRRGRSSIMSIASRPSPCSRRLIRSGLRE